MDSTGDRKVLCALCDSAFLDPLGYGIDEDQIVGKAKWMDSEFFDIVVKPSDDIPLSREQLKPVLQQLLQRSISSHRAQRTEARKGLHAGVREEWAETSTK